MVSISDVTGVLTLVSIIFGMAMAIIQLRNMARTRQAQLFMGIYDRFNDTDFAKQYTKVMYEYEWEDYDDWRKKYGPESPENYPSWLSVYRFFTGIGVLVGKKLVDVSLVNDLMRSDIINY